MSLLDFGHGPVTVPEDVIDAIKSNLDANHIYHRPKPKYKRFKRGQPVFITDGAFRDREGFAVVDNGQRVRVEFGVEVFGEVRQVVFERGMVEAFA